MAAALAVLEGPPDAAAVEESAAAWGLRVQQPEPDLCEVWAEHMPALRLFIGMRTQWREGFDGPTGLDYSVLPLVERRLGLTRQDAAQAFPHLQVMEQVALTWYRERAAR